MNKFVSTVTTALIAATLTGCVVAPRPVAQAPVQQAPRYTSGVQYGSIASIDTVRAQAQTTGGGALIGGATGALIGHQIDHGATKAGATLVGIVAGALIGNEIEKNQRGGGRDFYRVAVRMDDGAVRAFDYQSLGDIRVGDRVRVENNQVFRY